MSSHWAGFLGLVVLLTGCQGKPAIPASARYATASAVVDGTVYIVGGIERTGGKDRTVGTLEAYDPGARRWTACAPMSTPRAFAAAAALGGKVFVLGGLDSSGKPLDTSECFDPRTGAWTPCPPMGFASSRLAAANHMDHGISTAGGIDASSTDSVRARFFIPGENVWRDWPVLRTARHGLALVDAMDGTERIFAVGGYGADGPLPTVEVFGVGPSGKSGLDRKPLQVYDWRPGPSMAVPRGFFGLATVGRRAYAVGGRCREIPPTEVLDLDDVAAGWKKAAPLPKDLCRFSMVAWNGRLLVFGGETDFGASVNTEVLEYDPAADRWSVR